MAILHIGHIKAALKKRFDGLIDLSDVPNAAGDDGENFFLTRSLAAFVIAELANVDDKIAAKAIVDGSKDNGVDAFYFDPTRASLLPRTVQVDPQRESECGGWRSTQIPSRSHRLTRI